MGILAKMISAANSTEPLYVDDVFSTYLYAGNSSTQTITNGIDLAGEGGMVWIKGRDIATNNLLFDTVRGVNNYIVSDGTNSQANPGSSLTNFNSNGFSVNDFSNFINENTFNYASWTFRQAPKFFDVVTYTGNGSNRTIAHDLGIVPGMIIVKRTDTTGNWRVYHRGMTSAEYMMLLNDVNSQASSPTMFNSTAPTDTVFSIGTGADVNASGGTYVAYLFAHDDSDDGIIQCGSYTGTGAVGNAVTLGWEPQWLLVKRSSSGTINWRILDVMRGWTGSNPNDVLLTPNTSSAEAGTVRCRPTATGFEITDGTSTDFNTSGETYIYLAIRRPNKPPESGTQVFKAISRTGTGADATITGVGFSPDSIFSKTRSSAGREGNFDRLRGVLPKLKTPITDAEGGAVFALLSINMDGYTVGADPGDAINSNGPTFINWCFKRAPGFFDVVCDTGTGSAHTIAHNLAAVPELMIRKARSAAGSWVVYAGDATDHLILNTTAATTDLDTMWNDTTPTASIFTVGTNSSTNGSTVTFVTYLFATLAGISKVGSYTGTGTTQTINCGFTAGARFILIKRTDSTGDWYVWDTVRGIVAGNDPYLLLNSNVTEATGTDYIDTASTGFEISSTAPAAINANGGTFIYLAIA